MSGRAPLPDQDALQAAAAAREKGGLPAEQAFNRQRLGIFPGGVEHHLDGALDVAIRRGGVGGLNPEAARDGGANRGRIELGAFDGARFDHLRGQAFQRRFGTKTEPQSFHPAQQVALPMPDTHE